MKHPESLGYLGSLVRRSQQRHIAVWMSEVSTEITSVQYAALAALAGMPGASQRELGDALDLDRSTVADLVARLERNGFIERSPDATDRRRYTLELTTNGRSVLRELQPKVERAQDVLGAALTPDQRRQLQTLLTQLLAD